MQQVNLSQVSTNVEESFEIDLRWLEETVLDYPWIYINGEAGSGKSMLVANLIDLIKKQLGEEADLRILDTRYPLNYWSGIQPKYKGIDEVLVGIQEILDEFKTRFELLNEEFEPRFYVIDCVNWIGSESKLLSSLIDLITQNLNLSRSVQIHVILVGQLPFFPSINYEKFLNSIVTFSMGDNIAYLIEGMEKSSQKKNLGKEYNLRMQNYEKYKGTHNGFIHKYFVLVRIPGKEPFISSMPIQNLQTTDS